MQRLPNFNYKIFLLKFTIIVFIFFLDRASKMYLLNLQENGIEVDFYIFSFLNLYLVWNTGIGFGLFSFEADIYYQLTTTFIGIINLLIIYLIFNLKDIRKYFLLMILGGSLGNFFDRLYYLAVPDFIDFHIGEFHWFIFNIADVFISIGVLCLIFVEIFIKNINK
jgi:signal peptidase II